MSAFGSLAAIPVLAIMAPLRQVVAIPARYGFLARLRGNAGPSAALPAIASLQRPTRPPAALVRPSTYNGVAPPIRPDSRPVPLRPGWDRYIEISWYPPCPTRSALRAATASPRCTAWGKRAAPNCSARVTTDECATRPGLPRPPSPMPKSTVDALAHPASRAPASTILRSRVGPHPHPERSHH